MLDRQYGITYDDKDTIKPIIANKFFVLRCFAASLLRFENRLNFYLDKYEAIDINLIQIMYIVNNSLLTLRFKNINKEPLDKSLVNVKQTRTFFSR